MNEAGFFFIFSIFFPGGFPQKCHDTFRGNPPSGNFFWKIVKNSEIKILIFWLGFGVGPPKFSNRPRAEKISPKVGKMRILSYWITNSKRKIRRKKSCLPPLRSICAKGQFGDVYFPDFKSEYHMIPSL